MEINVSYTFSAIKREILAHIIQKNIRLILNCFPILAITAHILTYGNNWFVNYDEITVPAAKFFFPFCPVCGRMFNRIKSESIPRKKGSI